MIRKTQFGNKSWSTPGARDGAWSQTYSKSWSWLGAWARSGAWVKNRNDSWHWRDNL